MRPIPLALAILLLTATLRAAEVKVFAAASLTDALEEIAANYERQTHDRILFNFDASSTLARQIQQGAPADLFISADEEKMNGLAQRHLIDPKTRIHILSNTLVIIVPSEGGATIRSPRQLANVHSIALAEPSSVPAGIYARQYLQKLGIWERLSGRIVPTTNVRAALAAVASGNVEAAIVYKTDAITSKRVRIAYEVAREEGPEISYPFAVVAGAGEAHAAARFLASLRSKPALDIFRKRGFLIR